MPTFRYTAKRGPQDIVEGLIEAEDRGGVLMQLAELGYVPVRISEQAGLANRAREVPAPKVRMGRVPVAHLTVFTRQFASLVRSSVPLLRALTILQEQTRHPYLRHVLRAVAEEVRQGQTLSSALAKFPTVFVPLYVNLVHSGEVSGALDAVLERLATQAEQEAAMRGKVRLAFLYPTFVAVTGAGTVVFLMTFVMPRLSRLLEGLGDRLPLATQLLLAVAGVMSRLWFWLLLVGAIAALAALWKGSGRRGRLIADRVMLRMPLLGPLLQQVEMARFARSLSLQISHGISILQAADVAVQVVDNRVIRGELERLPEGLRQGSTLSSCLKALSIGSALLVNTVAVGEESGKVGEALMEVAGSYERDSERLLQTLATLLEPVLILGVGLVVGFIVVAVLLPIFEMSAMNP